MSSLLSFLKLSSFKNLPSLLLTLLFAVISVKSDQAVFSSSFALVTNNPASSFDEAETYCNNNFLRGHLAAVTSQSKQNTISLLYDELNSKFTTYWIGGSALGTSSACSYSWSSGATWSYSNFETTPTCTNGATTCIKVDGSNSHQWTLEDCSTSINNFVCQYDNEVTYTLGWYVEDKEFSETSAGCSYKTSIQGDTGLWTDPIDIVSGPNILTTQGTWNYFNITSENVGSPIATMLSTDACTDKLRLDKASVKSTFHNYFQNLTFAWVRLDTDSGNDGCDTLLITWKPNFGHAHLESETTCSHSASPTRQPTDYPTGTKDPTEASFSPSINPTLLPTAMPTASKRKSSKNTTSSSDDVTIIIIITVLLIVVLVVAIGAFIYYKKQRSNGSSPQKKQEMTAVGIVGDNFETNNVTQE